MEVMKNSIAASAAPRVITKESMQLDFEYEIAQKLTRSMYEKGMISLDEMNRSGHFFWKSDNYRELIILKEFFNYAEEN